MHPYQMQRLLRLRHKDEILVLKRGSLYHAIGRLMRAGLIAVKTTGREGKRPERTRRNSKDRLVLNRRIRLALHNGSFENLLSGECEADDFIGGKARNGDDQAERINAALRAILKVPRSAVMKDTAKRKRARAKTINSRDRLTK